MGHYFLDIRYNNNCLVPAGDGRDRHKRLDGLVLNKTIVVGHNIGIVLWCCGSVFRQTHIFIRICILSTIGSLFGFCSRS